MGFFSWKCAVDGISIPAYPHAGFKEELSDVALVLPDDKVVIGIYNGYGEISGTDIYDELARIYFGGKADRNLIFNSKKYMTSPTGERPYLHARRKSLKQSYDTGKSNRNPCRQPS